MIREYVDCFVRECDHCGKELEVLQAIHKSELKREHFCDEHRPACCECGVYLDNDIRFPAPDLTPDGQEVWHRCRIHWRKHVREHDTIPCPPPDSEPPTLRGGPFNDSELRLQELARGTMGGIQ